MLDQRLRHAGIDVVVRHLVADAIGAPAQRQLRQVAGADHDAVVVVGQAEQIVGAQTGLHILERQVVDRLAPRERVADIAQHAFGGGADVELPPGDAESLHQPDRVRLGVRGGGEAGHGVGKDIAARQPEQVERPAAHDQRVGGIEPARHADHHAFDPGRAQPLRQAGDLDVVGLVAILLEPCGIGRHERKALDLALQTDIAGRRIQPEGDAAERGGMAAAVGVEAAHLHALVAQQVEVDIGHARTGRPTGNARSRPASRRSRRSRPGRPRRDRWWTRRRRPRRRDRPPRSAPIARRTAAAASPPCRS